MTKKELIDSMQSYSDDCEVMIVGETVKSHYEITEVYSSYDEDLEKDVIVLSDF